MLLSVVRLGMLVPAVHHPGRRCQLGGQSGVRVPGGDSALRGLTGDRVSNDKSPCVGALAALDHWNGMFIPGDGERVVLHPGRCSSPETSAVNASSFQCFKEMRFSAAC